MAKLYFIIVCVCYCTACIHLIAAKMAATKEYDDQSNVYDSNSASKGLDNNVNDAVSTHSLTNAEQSDVIKKQRVKRHGAHAHSTNIKLDSFIDVNPNTKEFIKKIFRQFGNGDEETMNINEFERMIQQLGLYRLLEDQQGLDTSSDLAPHNEKCISSVSLLSNIAASQDPDNSENIERYNSLINEMKGQSIQSNATANHNHTAHQSSIETIKSIKGSINVERNDLYSVCPILLYQLTAPKSSPERDGCIATALLSANKPHEHHVHIDFNETDRQLVWIYASLSIFVASLCGLIGVAVIPCMERRYYQYILQFFVALAIGTLAGDALLHLMPHSMMTFSTLEHQHANMTYKGLVAALGIIFFFVTERILAMVAEWRKRIHRRDDPPSRVRVMRDHDSVSISQSLNGEKQCKHKYSSYPYCYDEIAMETKDNIHQHHKHTRQQSNNSQAKENGSKVTNMVAQSPKMISLDSSNDYPDTAQSLLSSRNHNADAQYRGDKDDLQTPDNNTIATNLDDGSLDICGCEHKKTSENYTVILREHETKHHGHSHTHGHVHSPPKTLSAVAWMVIMGDGLHNFTDGMAIGAAFSNSIAGGFSTAIAVFCHELPHELGDFAVLLKAGMSAKKAAYYNILSSVLSFFGMVVGIIVGDTPEASAWIFACAAGMFLYIALVDMMPELTTAHNEHSAIMQCFLQLLGMVIGVGIMLVIALYEDDLTKIFVDDQVEYHSPHYHSDHDH